MSEVDLSATEARWRNYQKLIWTQQQIHLQIQQQQQQQQQFQNQKMNGIDGTQDGASALIHHQAASGQQQQQPEMSEKPMEEAPAKDTLDPWENFDAHAAFLGPTLWDKRLPYDGQDFKLEYVDLEEFLSENGIPMDPQGNADQANRNQQSQQQQQQQQQQQHGQASGGDLSEIVGGNELVAPLPSDNQMMAGPSRMLHSMRPSSMMHHNDHSSRSPSPSGSQSSGISHDLSTDNSSDSNHAASVGNSIVSFAVPFSIAELALGSVPGQDFDPKTRSFTEDELKPQPMIKKSRKQFVPDEAKDTKYWARRRKNNMAAKRSRDARRVKENQIAMRACYLEKENMALKQELDRLQKENILLKEQLRCCRRDH